MRVDFFTTSPFEVATPSGEVIQLSRWQITACAVAGIVGALFLIIPNFNLFCSSYYFRSRMVKELEENPRALQKKWKKRLQIRIEELR